MAEASMNVNVSMEATAHKMFQELAQKLYDEYGLRVDAVHISWMSVQTMNEARPAIVPNAVSVSSVTFPSLP